MPGKLLKRILVFTGLDKIIAGLWHRWRLPLFSRLIPAPAYYKGHNRSVKRYGVRFRVRPEDLSQWFVFNDSDTQHVRAAMRVLNHQSQGIIVDAGANIGQFSLVLARYLRKHGLSKRIMSFEPNPSAYSFFKRNLMLNRDLVSFVSPYQIGLGSADEYRELSIPKRNTGAGTLIESYDHEPYDHFLVSVKKLDTLVHAPVEFIKIDVEGFEYYVLQGAAKILCTYHPAIYLETNQQQPKQRELFEWLQELGYSFYFDDGRDFIVTNLDEITRLEGVNNILAIASGNYVSQHETVESTRGNG